MRNLAVVLIVGWAGIAIAANPNLPADFTINNTILVSNPPRVGTNIQQPQFNNWTLDPGMEPITLRHHGFATGGGTTFILNTGTPNTSFNDTLTDGFFDGATIRIYRSISGQMQLIRTDTITNYFASVPNGFRINLASAGTAILAGDLYFIDFAADNVPFASVSPTVLPTVSAIDSWTPEDSTTVFRDSSTTPPENGGQTSLRVTIPISEFTGIQQSRFGQVANFQESLVPGVTYRVEMWLRQVGVASGNVIFNMDQDYSSIATTFIGVTGAWTKYSFDFVAPPRPTTNTIPVAMHLAFQGPGSIWVDNFYLYDPSIPLFDPLPETIQALQDFNPETVRIWSGVPTSTFGTTMAEWTDPEIFALRSYESFSGGLPTEASWKLPTVLPIVRDLGADPWLIMGPNFDEQEWLELFDYLAGPAGTPFADKRIAQGQVAPWSDQFNNIYFEFSNESWNLDPNFIWSMPATTYGQLAEHFFAVAQTSPHYAAIASKVHFIVNGFMLETSAAGHGQVAKAQSSSAESISIAPYIVAPGGPSVTNQGFQDYLLTAPTFLRFFIDAHAATRQAIGTYTLAAYEGGPGFAVSSPSQPFDPIAEAYGRSLAAGVSTLDLYLYATLQNIRPLNYFTLFAGTNEASHSTFASGFRPHPTWLGLQMRNTLATGDMIGAVTNSTPTADVAATVDTPAFPDTPLAISYAFRNGTRYSVFVLSRKFSGATPVTLRLPFNFATQVTRHEMTGDPTSTNVNSQLIQVTQTPVTDFFSDIYTFTIPASTATLFVFENTATAPTADEIVTAEPGDNVTLMLPGGLPVHPTNPNYQWTLFPDGATILGTTNALSLTNVSLIDSGFYILTYDDGTGPTQYVIQLQIAVVVPATDRVWAVLLMLLLVSVAACWHIWRRSLRVI